MVLYLNLMFICQKPSEFFGGEVLAKYYKDVLSVAHFRELSEYDSSFTDALNLQLKAISINSVTAEQAVDNMEKELLGKIEGSTN